MAGGALSRRAARGLVEAGHRLQAGGLAAATEGNLSVRTGPDRLLITPAGARKGELRVRDLVTVRFTGEAWEVMRAAPGRRPSSELGLHLALYRRAGVAAVVHVHPPHATAFAAAGRSLEPPALAEQVLMLGEIPLLGFAPPGTPAVAALVAGLPPESRAFLLAGHGAVTVGRDLEEAVLRMEALEACARITLLARLLEPGAALTDQARAALRAAGGPGGH
jgi:L-fuculose-phosphate aldolase